MDKMQQEIDEQMEKFILNLKKEELPLLKELLKKYFYDAEVRKKIKNIIEVLGA